MGEWMPIISTAAVLSRTNFCWMALPTPPARATPHRIILQSPPPDAVAEAKVQTSTYDAQYGRAGGGTINVGLKGGTNNFHGVAYDYWRNTVLNANTFDAKLSGQGKPAF